MLVFGCKKKRGGKKIERHTYGQVSSLVGQHKSFVCPQSLLSHCLAWTHTHTHTHTHTLPLSHAHIRICTRVYARTHIHTCITHICVHPGTPHTCTRALPCSHTEVHTHTSTHKYKCMHTHTRARVYPCAHTYLFLKNRPSI